MKKVFLGLDIGSISTKGVVIDEDNKVLASRYIWTEGNPIKAVREVAQFLLKEIGKLVAIAGVGTTGSARKLAGAMLNATVIKNEITAHAVGAMSAYPEVRTIFEIGGQDSKIILIENGVVSDYAMNTLCAAGTGSFLSSQAVRLGVPVEKFGELALKSKNPAKIAARCTVFAESDLVHKAQIGYKKEDIIAGLCNAVVSNYLNNLAKGKRIQSPVVFQGGVSRNAGVVAAFEKATGQKIHVDHTVAHIMGALGVAIIAKNAKCEKEFDISVLDQPFETKGQECTACANNCELVHIYRDNKRIDIWGARCEKKV